MADPIFKVRFIFGGGPKARGWTESYFVTRPEGGNTANAASVANAATTVAQRRAILLGKEFFVQGWSASIEVDEAGNPVIGDSFIIEQNLNATNPGNDGDSPNQSLLVTAFDAAGRRKKNIFMRGIWDNICVVGGLFVNNQPGWNAAFQAWATAVTNEPYRWRSRTAVFPKGQVINYVQNVDFTTTITVTAAFFPTLQIGTYQTVRIQGVNVKSAINGDQVVFVTAANSCVIQKPIALFPFTSPGKITRYTYSYPTIATLVPRKIDTRKAGAPLLQQRGRAPRRARG